MKLKVLPIFVSLLVLASSCKKEAEPTETTEPTPFVNRHGQSVSEIRLYDQSMEAWMRQHPERRIVSASWEGGWVLVVWDRGPQASCCASPGAATREAR